MRLSGLSPGAKLELVMLSRSPSVVKVALQIPEREASEVAGGRLIQDFASSTTLWLVLRSLENREPQKNFTARGKTRTETGESGAGRLYHEAPILNIMGRELGTFTDLQKTLAQLGYNSGNVLLRLSFKVSETPLEEAMEHMEQYFASIQSDEKAGAHPTSPPTSGSISDTISPALPKEDDSATSPPEPVSPSQIESIPANTPGGQRGTFDEPSEEFSVPVITDPEQRPIAVFKPSSSSTPRAAQQAFNERDYEPTIAHAKLHQARLQNSGRNKPLLSDKELAEKENAKAQKCASVKKIAVKIRFPDQTTINADFTNLDTAGILYDCAKGVLASEDEPFLLNFISAKGPSTIPRDSSKRLISDLGMSGSTLVNFLWDEGASAGARTSPVLKAAVLARAKEVEVPEVPETGVDEEKFHDSDAGKRKETVKSPNKGIQKWVSRLSKK
ncbi:MAG: hypothetical protein LQ352_001269 [Teloschistes flavicans]|nr:MAG: hypothetical protein LQ352_001269 [Teloschistes flavicans]